MSKEPPTEIDVLLSEYAAARVTFERLDSATASLLGLALTISPAMAALVARQCTFGPLECRPGANSWLYGLLPLVPLALLLLVADIGNARTVKVYYGRAIETRLRESGFVAEVTPGVQVPSYGELMAVTFGQHRGSMRYRVVLWLVYALVGTSVLMLVGLCVAVASPLDYQVALVVAYSAGFALLARLTWLGGPGARGLWKDSQHRLTQAMQTPNSDDSNSGDNRGLARYLLVPRPHELYTRVGLPPLAWAVAASAAGTLNSQGLVAAIVAGAVFEFLFYQARYVINDLRGLGIDGVFSNYKKSNRFPTPIKPAWPALALVATLFRLAIGVWITLRFLDSGLGRTVLFAAGVLALQTVLYEWIKPRAARGGPGFARASNVVYALVGVGWALRASIGIAVSGSFSISPVAAWLWLLGWSLFGTMAVTLAWSIGAVDQVRGTVGTPLPTSLVGPALALCWHVVLLARQVGIVSRGQLFGAPIIDSDRERQQVLRLSQLLVPVSAPTWWNTCFVASTALVAVAVTAISAPEAPVWVPASVGAGAAVWSWGLVASFAKLARPKREGAKASSGRPLVAAAACGGLAGTSAWLLGDERWWSIWIAVALASAAYVELRLATTESTQRAFSATLGLAMAAARTGADVVVGVVGGRAARDAVEAARREP